MKSDHSGASGKKSKSSDLALDLAEAWVTREKLGVPLPPIVDAALRIFHGPGEGRGRLASFLVEGFGKGVWVFERESAAGSSSIAPEGLLASGTSDTDSILSSLRDRLIGLGFKFGVFLPRPLKGAPAEPRAFFGEPPPAGLIVREPGDLQFQIRFLNTKHPGLFLDHAPLRAWLLSHARDLRVLNTFAYTGSLSVAAGRGGASEVTTLDLSRPNLNWAEENWALNGLEKDRHRVLHGDYFEWLSRLAKKNAQFEVVILDPPSFSRAKNGGTFSTAKDLIRLHESALRVLAPRGYLITSINSANISRDQFEREWRQAARSAKRDFEVVSEIYLPQSFPVRPGDPEGDYLKGWILRAKN